MKERISVKKINEIIEAQEKLRRHIDGINASMDHYQFITNQVQVALLISENIEKELALMKKAL